MNLTNDINDNEEITEISIGENCTMKTTICKITNRTKIEYYKNGLLHRDDDKPALIENNVPLESGPGYFKLYYKEGKLHRDGDKPAMILQVKEDKKVIFTLKQYCQEDKLHRDGDKPAILESTGYKAYYKENVEYTPEKIIKNKRNKKIT